MQYDLNGLFNCNTEGGEDEYCLKKIHSVPEGIQTDKNQEIKN